MLSFLCEVSRPRHTPGIISSYFYFLNRFFVHIFYRIVNASLNFALIVYNYVSVLFRNCKVRIVYSFFTYIKAPKVGKIYGK